MVSQSAYVITSQSISSQLRLRNNVVQDTIKVIKLSSFLFKILCTFVRLHSSDLFADYSDWVMRPLLGVLVRINSICLDDMPRGICADEPQRRFQAIKADFLKEYAAQYEQLLQHVLVDDRLVAALSHLSPDHVDSEDQDTDSAIKAEITLFYSICVNRISKDVDFEATIERLAKFLTNSQYVVYSSVYCSYSKRFIQDPQLDFSRFAASPETDTSFAVHFYDFILTLIGKFILQSGLNPAKIYYLASNVASAQPVKAQLSYDLFLYFMQNYAATSNDANFMNIVKFISSLYESTGLVVFRHLLTDIFDCC